VVICLSAKKDDFMQIELNEQVALVTGSAHRVGKAIAIALAKEGVHIMVHYNHSDDATVRETLQDIKSEGVKAFAFQADISQPDGVEALMAAFKEHFDELSILVNSASVFPTADFLDITLDSWNLAMNVNLRAPFLLTQQAAKLMKDNEQGGAIINICDQGAFAPFPKRAHHGISKYGLWMLTQVSALALAPDIRVNAIVPGPILKNNMSDAAWQKLGEEIPLRKTGHPNDVGRAVIFLARENFLTGAKIEVNGGEHLLYPQHNYDE
jgi:NAD(P)-dependent dehydrogenase (short-subunit alcohol dehydrogenase family)